MQEKLTENELKNKTIGLQVTLADTLTAGVWAVGRALWRGFRDEQIYGIPTSIDYRLLNMIGETIVGRPYGLFRDYLCERFAITEESSLLKKFFIEGTANGIFYMPLYATTLYMSGADEKQIVTACGISLGTSLVIGHPYGKSLEFTRYLLQGKMK